MRELLFRLIDVMCSRSGTAHVSYMKPFMCQKIWKQHLARIVTSVPKVLSKQRPAHPPDSSSESTFESLGLRPWQLSDPHGVWVCWVWVCCHWTAWRESAQTRRGCDIKFKISTSYSVSLRDCVLDLIFASTKNWCNLVHVASVYLLCIIIY